MHKLILAFLILAALTPHALAEPLKRHILALYNGSDERSIEATRLHLLLETPFNHLGYILDYRQLSEELPPLDTLQDYAAVVSWIEADVVVTEAYFRRANQAMDAGVKWIVFGDIGASSESRAHPEYDGFLRRLGLIDTGDYVSVAYDSSYDVVDDRYFGFEAQLSPVLPGYPVYNAASEGEDILLSAQSPRISDPSVLATVSENGGYVASGYAMDFFEDLERTMWFLDPFTYLASVMDRGPWPVPDTTTLAGRRMYFSHIDGDGWINASHAVPGQVSAEVIQHQIIEAYPDLPVSVGLVAGDVVYEDNYVALVERTARDIFALPQVEIASHTMTHPFHWTKLVAYDREAELEDIAARALTELENAKLEPAQKAKLSDPWRFFASNPYDVVEEISGALDVSNRYAPPGKTAQLYLWSGDTSPGPEELRASREAGVFNMNGGDTRLDGEFPSYTYVAPLSRTVGTERQVYAANSNENTYTNLWRGPFYGQYLLEETWQRTGAPFRLRPMNLYYHMYAGERFGSLSALIHHLDIARAGNVIPVAASSYPRIVNDFFATKIAQLGAATWSIADFGSLGTVRFDNVSGDLKPDYGASRGIIGHRHDQGSLYIKLDTALVEVKLALTAEPNEEISVRQSRWALSDVRTEDCSLSGVVQGYGAFDMELWAPEGDYRIVLSRGTEVLFEQSAASTNGVVAIRADVLGYEPLTLGVTCTEVSQ